MARSIEVTLQRPQQGGDKFTLQTRVGKKGKLFDTESIVNPLVAFGEKSVHLGSVSLQKNLWTFGGVGALVAGVIGTGVTGLDLYAITHNEIARPLIDQNINIGLTAAALSFLFLAGGALSLGSAAYSRRDEAITGKQIDVLGDFLKSNQQ